MRHPPMGAVMQDLNKSSFFSLATQLVGQRETEVLLDR